MITIHVTGRDGRPSSHHVPTGRPLMFLLRDVAGLPVEGLCGGCATCGTCHVYVDADWMARLNPPAEHEAAMLDMLESFRRGQSRLSCQIEASASIDGLSIELAPEE